MDAGDATLIVSEKRNSMGSRRGSIGSAKHQQCRIPAKQPTTVMKLVFSRPSHRAYRTCLRVAAGRKAPANHFIEVAQRRAALLAGQDRAAC